MGHRARQATLAPITTPSDDLPDFGGRRLFRVFHTPSDPHQVGEFVVYMDRDGISIWPSDEWTPEAEPGPDDAHFLSWHDINFIGGDSRETFDRHQRDLDAIWRELADAHNVRDGECNRINRAREIGRTQHVRRLVSIALEIRSIWMPPEPMPVRWRDMTSRGREKIKQQYSGII